MRWGAAAGRGASQRRCGVLCCVDRDKRLRCCSTRSSEFFRLYDEIRNPWAIRVRCSASPPLTHVTCPRRRCRPLLLRLLGGGGGPRLGHRLLVRQARSSWAGAPPPPAGCPPPSSGASRPCVRRTSSSAPWTPPAPSGLRRCRRRRGGGVRAVFLSQPWGNCSMICTSISASSGPTNAAARTPRRGAGERERPNHEEDDHDDALDLDDGVHRVHALLVVLRLPRQLGDVVQKFGGCLLFIEPM